MFLMGGRNSSETGTISILLRTKANSGKSSSSTNRVNSFSCVCGRNPRRSAKRYWAMPVWPRWMTEVVMPMRISGRSKFAMISWQEKFVEAREMDDVLHGGLQMNKFEFDLFAFGQFSGAHHQAQA